MFPKTVRPRPNEHKNPRGRWPQAVPTAAPPRAWFNAAPAPATPSPRPLPNTLHTYLPHGPPNRICPLPSTCRRDEELLFNVKPPYPKPRIFSHRHPGVFESCLGGPLISSALFQGERPSRIIMVPSADRPVPPAAQKHPNYPPTVARPSTHPGRLQCPSTPPGIRT